jgi:hypothetical protein
MNVMRIAMTEATYWWEEATKFKQQAQVTDDHAERESLLELAEVCVEVAATIEERICGG